MSETYHSGQPNEKVITDRRDNTITTRENGNTDYTIAVTTEKTEYTVRTTSVTSTDETVNINIDDLPEDADFKERFFEAQDRLAELEGELKNTRSKLRNLENACENTEEKIGVLKNAAFSYHRQFSEHERSYKTILEENRLLKISVEKHKKEKEESDEIRKNIADLQDQLGAAKDENQQLTTQLDDLRDTIAQHDAQDCERCALRDAEDDDLRGQMESLKLKCEELENEKETLEKVKNELKDEVKRLETKLSADDEVIEEMKRQIIDYRVQINEAEENSNRSRMRSIELEMEVSSLRDHVAELETSLKSENDIIREGTKRFELLTKKVTQLEITQKEICREKEHLHLQFVDSKNKAEVDAKQLRQQLNEANVRAELFKKELADKEKILLALRAENEELKGLKDDLAALKQQLQDAQDREATRFAIDQPGQGDDSSDADGEVSTDEEEEGTDDLKRENEELRQEVSQLRDAVISLQVELATKIQDKDQTATDGGPDKTKLIGDAPLAELERDLSDSDDKEEDRIVAVSITETLSAMPPGKESEDSWSDQDYFRGQVQELEDQLKRANDGKKRMEEQLTEAENKAAKTIDELSKTISQLNEKCEEMRKELIEKEIIINKLRREQSASQNQVKELQEKLKEKEYLEAELEKAKGEIMTLKSKNDFKEKYERLKTEHDKVLDDRRELTKENQDLIREKEKLEAEMKEMNERFDRGKKMYGELCDENDDLEKKVKKLEEEIKFLNVELSGEEDVHSKQKEDLETKIKNLQETIRELERKLADLEAKQDDTNWKEKHEEERREKNSLKLEKQSLERNLKNSEEEHENTKSRYGKTRQELMDVRGENTKLIQQHSEVRREKEASERELNRLNETLKRKEEECKRLLKELEELKRTLQRQASDDRWHEKFETLKLKFEEIKGEKDSLQKEKNNLQNELRKGSERLAEVEIKLSQARAEKEGLNNDFEKSHSKVTQIELELQRCNKQKQQAEEEAKWIKKELLIREETITRLEKELGDKRNMEEIENEKDVRIVVLEREIQLLQSRIPASEKDESVIKNQIRLLEEKINDITEQLHGKTVQLDECGKENERLTIHVVELSKEIQSLYQRYEASQAEIALLLAAKPEEPTTPVKLETTSLTIDVEQAAEVHLGVHVQERVTSRIVTPGHGRSTCAIDVPISRLPGTVVIGEPVGVTIDRGVAGRNLVVTHSADLTASEPEDNADDQYSDDEDEDQDIPMVDQMQLVESVPPPPQPSVTSDPERILVSAQAIPGTQLPRSLDPIRYPFIKGSGVRLNPGAFQPVPFRRKEDPFGKRYLDEQSNDMQPTPIGRFKALSETDLNRLDGIPREGLHHREPPENGPHHQVAQPIYRVEEQWPELYQSPPIEGVFVESAPAPQKPINGVYAKPLPEDEHPNDYRKHPHHDGQVVHHLYSYEPPPKKPEVYVDYGNVIGYQEVNNDDYSNEMEGPDRDRPNVRQISRDNHRAEPLAHDNKRHLIHNVPYKSGARQPVRQLHDRDVTPKYRHDDSKDWQDHNANLRREVRGDEWRRRQPFKQYAMGSYL